MGVDASRSRPISRCPAVIPFAAQSLLRPYGVESPWWGPVHRPADNPMSEQHLSLQLWTMARTCDDREPCPLVSAQAEPQV